MFRQQAGQVEDRYASGSNYWDDPTKPKQTSGPVTFTIDKPQYPKLNKHVYGWESEHIVNQNLIDTDIEDIDIPPNGIFLVVNYLQGSHQRARRDYKDVYYVRGDGKVCCFDELLSELYEYDVTPQQIIQQYTKGLAA